MVELQDIQVEEIKNDHYFLFQRIRKSVMKVLLASQNMKWNEEKEEVYHRELFGQDGLRVITLKNSVIGFIGISRRNDSFEISRFCIEVSMQKKGIGTYVMQVVLADPKFKGTAFVLEVMKASPARRLYERLGFQVVTEDERMAYYKRVSRT